MIIFERIRWKNFLSTGNQFTEINFLETPSTLIIGNNGAGKSTMLDALGVSDVSLLSNNPDKAKQLEKYGINVVEMVPLIVGVGSSNRDYLQTKAERMGHEIELDGE